MDVIFPETTKILYELSYKLAIRYAEFRKKYPDLQENDIRVTTYGKCANTVENVLYCYIFQDEQLTNINWYKKIRYFKNIKNSQIVQRQDSFEKFVMVSFVTSYFAIFEMFFRIVLKKFDKKNYKTYEIINKSLELFDLKNDERIFSLFRIIRNSLHNNGMITDPNVKPIVYNGKIYKLEQNKIIIVDWILLTKLAFDMFECMDKITTSKKILSYEEILDPSYFNQEIGYEMYSK